MDLSELTGLALCAGPRSAYVHHMTSTIPSSTEYVAHEPRFDLARDPAEQYRAMLALAGSIRLDRTLHDLIEIRVSQLNGCAYCLDMHLQRARAHGESEQRLDTLAGWHESPFFTARERAALALAEAITRIHDQPAVVAAYAEAERHIDADELPQVVFATTVINSWNRLTITAGSLPPTR
jgi:AhpD family alkylhydroperoxidase